MSLGLFAASRPSPVPKCNGPYMLAGRLSIIDVRRAKAALSSGCKPRPANSLPPEGTGAFMEVTI
jgi:hypothetical protein